MINYLLNFEKFRIIKALFDQSHNKYLQYKINTLQATNFWYLVTIRIETI